MPEASPSSHAPGAPLAFLAVSCGVGVSAMYLCQPLLVEMGATFHASAGEAGLIAVATQTGYAAGLLGFVPLGDIVERRGLMVRLYAAVAVALLLVALAPTLPLLLLASAAAGAMASVTHVALPIAPDLASPSRRGRAIGVVMTGLLLGVLLARTVAGWLNDLSLQVTHRVAGWRVVFGVWALVCAGFAPAMHRLMPKLPPRQQMRYPQAMRSLWHLFREEPLLRESCLMGGLVFGSFNAFWNSLAFVLGSHSLGAGVAGSFGLVGAAGVLIAAQAGKLSDRRGPRYVMSLALGCLGTAYGLLFLLERAALSAQVRGALHIPLYLLALALVVVLLDVGAQGAQLANQTRIFALRPGARSRINTVYMVSYFTGAAIASALSTVAWQHFGYRGVGLLEMALLLLAVLRHATGSRTPYVRHVTRDGEDIAAMSHG